MSEKTKSILAETLLDIQNAKQQVEENANFILTSTLKDELSEILKKGLAENFTSDDDESTEDITANDDAVDQAPVDDAPVSDETPSEDPITSTEPSIDGADAIPGEEEVVDLTGATPEEVIGSFKLMAPTDEIEIVRSDNGIAINFPQQGSDVVSTGDDENSIAVATQLPPADGVADITPDADPLAEPTADLSSDTPETPADDEDEDKLYEIEITEEDEPVEEAMSHHMNMKKKNIAHNGNDPLRVDEEVPVTETEEEKIDVKESREKLVAARKKVTALTLENKKLKADLAVLNENTNTFKTSEADYKKAITSLKTQLQEVALFTSNLTYAVKLMTENTTTKDEKINILRRLDGAKSVTESREVFKTLNESFKAGKSSPVDTILDNKILSEEKISGASKINETKVYENPGVARIKEIIGKMR